MFNRIAPLACLAAFALPALAGNTPGIKNFDRVDEHVYRGAQPTPEGFRYLAGIGVRTVIDLRETGARARAEQRLVTQLGMTYLNVPMTGLAAPTETELLKILPVLENSSPHAVYVHCWRGADRTGAVIAAYHIDHDHWENARALRDAKAHNMGFFQIPREEFIKHFRPRIEANKVTDTGGPVATPIAGTSAAIRDSAQPHIAPEGSRSAR